MRKWTHRAGKIFVGRDRVLVQPAACGNPDPGLGPWLRTSLRDERRRTGPCPVQPAACGNPDPGLGPCTRDGLSLHHAMGSELGFGIPLASPFILCRSAFTLRPSRGAIGVLGQPWYTVRHAQCMPQYRLIGTVRHARYHMRGGIQSRGSSMSKGREPRHETTPDSRLPLANNTFSYGVCMLCLWPGADGAG